MATCAGCGAPIQWAVRDDTLERVPLEPRAEYGRGEDRYIIVGYGSALKHVVRRVSPHAEVEAYSDHRRDCPDYHDGRQ